jgi:hypothetical protein
MACTPLSVDIEVHTPDQLRKILFGLERACNNNGTENWTLRFEVDERPNRTASFDLLVKLDVKISEVYHAAAEATARARGLDATQTAQALVAGQTASDFRSGQATQTDVRDDAEATIAVRSTGASATA